MTDTMTAPGIVPTLIFVFVTTFTPGPNNILSASSGAFYGYQRTLPFMLGIASGFLMIMTVCFLLSSALGSILPSVLPALRIGGALYILWLAYTVVRNSRVLDQPDEVKPLGFWYGCALQLVNPKAAVYGLTVFSTFLAPTLHDPIRFLYLPLFLALVSFASVTTWALGGQLIRRVLNSPGRVRAFATLMALALVYTAIEILDIAAWFGKGG